MTFGFNWTNTAEEAEIAPGTLGLLVDEIPPLTSADVRPFVWSVLLFRKGARSSEIVGAITPICAHSELYSGWSDFLEEEDDRTRLEYLVDEVLGDMTAAGLLNYSEEKDLWTLSLGPNQKNLPTIIKAVAGVNGSLPGHLILDL